MSRARRPAARQLLGALLALAIALVVVLVALGGGSSSGGRSRPLESILQDDAHLIYASTPTVRATLDTLRRLGVQTIRATVLWRAIAPDPASSVRPDGFQASDPADYPQMAWAPYDRLVKLARARDIGIDFDLTAPGPLWAMARDAPSGKYADDWAPSAAEYGRFVAAVATRYSGDYHAPGGSLLPRVSFWSIWNEPNQPGWLAPQWQAILGVPAMESAILYRAYVDAAFRSLLQTGHGPSTDTILIGELAPDGSEGPSYSYRSPTPPMSFLRALYCVSSRYRPQVGSRAVALACPANGDPSAFVAANPGLFDATGFAHHPYSFSLAPSAQAVDQNSVPLSDLSRLEQGLDAIFSAYGVRRTLPLYLTQYGYETDPPNPFRGVSPTLQAQYINEAEYMAWRDPRVHAMSQLLLYDAPPDRSYLPGSTGYWSTLQTGLLYANGRPKPSFGAYRLPVFLPDPILGRRRRVFVWARLRSASPGSKQRAQIQWQAPGGPFRDLETISTEDPNGVLTADVQLPGPGNVRIAWSDPGGRVLYSRAVRVQR